MADALPAEPDLAAALADTLEFLAVEPTTEDGRWVGQPPVWSGDYLFGGFVIAQAIIAATRQAPRGCRMHSMHAYFLRPATSRGPIDYQVEAVREGRSFTACRLRACQGDKAILEMSCSFTSDVDGYIYDLPGRQDIAGPGDLPIERGPGPWVAAYLGPTTPAADGTRESTHRMWFRIPAALPDDQHIHAAFIGFATDWTGVGGRPLHLEGDTQGMISLDHAVWFHRPARADTWLLYDVHSLVNAGGRGLLRGVMRDTTGHVLVSATQEMRLTPV